ncbi:hypothetical protein OC835_007209 [Tilletia horrida]|nr:hypothetical protein OC835_007209 [Tilletia horrida]
MSSQQPAQQPQHDGERTPTQPDWNWDDRSSSEASDAEAEDLRSTFLQVEGEPSPEDRLFTVQFPKPFPPFARPDGQPPAPREPTWRGNPEGQIGELLILSDGSVKLATNDGPVFDIEGAIPHSDLQQIMALDGGARKAYVMGEVNRRFLASLDLDHALADIEGQQSLGIAPSPPSSPSLPSTAKKPTPSKKGKEKKAY